MSYNLTREPWLPLRRRDGAREWVEPWRLTDQGPKGDNPFLAVDSPRPDFNGALTEFLIGLLQTAWPPADERAWHQAWRQPPGPEELRAAFEKVATAFDLDGPGPRFMQQILPDKAECWDAHLLLIEQPEPTKEKDNKDHFIKRGQVGGICQACLAAALYTLQTYAPSGGRGHFTSIRGGGPLTTLVLGDTLWQTAWLAVQSQGRFWASQARQTEASRIFPWLGPSLQGDKETHLTLEQADPAQLFWGLPRRVWLDFAQTPGLGQCTICGRQDEALLDGFWVRPNGIKYEGPWLHPLSPHYWKDGEPFAVKGPSGGLGYRHWLGLALAQAAGGTIKGDQDKTIVLRAQAVSLFEERAPRFTLPDAGQAPRRLWAFGYDMDNKKARAWVEARMPLVLVEPRLRQAYEQGVRALVDCAGQAASALTRCLKEAWLGPNSKAKTNQGDLERLGQLFWANSEADFYRAADALQALLESGGDYSSLDDDQVNGFKEKWLKTLQDRVLAIYEQYSQYSQIEQANPKRIALARKKLLAWVGPWAKKLRETLDLPMIKKTDKVTNQGKGEAA